ncbi:MAG: hypothetical protein MJ108_07615 [Saccharofermentans sp.]|nr:hypothetical protein [Saccharofermentans sp.]
MVAPEGRPFCIDFSRSEHSKCTNNGTDWYIEAEIFSSDEFINKKYDKGASREKVFDGFTQSPEFVALCEKSGIIPFG